MKTNYLKHSLFFLLAAFALCSCSNDDETTPATDGIVLNIHATTQGFLSNDGINTRASETNYTTKFADGDEIGVFAVKADGTIIEGCNNLMLTYSSTDGWTGGPVYYYKGATYFAYYPYSASMDNTASVDKIIAAFTPIADQSSYANYTKSDLMTTADAVSPNAETKALDFTFTHKMAMVEISLPVQKYKTSNMPDAYEYSAPALGAKFNIGGTAVKPCAMGKGVFRYIVAAGNIDVNGEFSTTDDRTIEYSKTGLALQPGNYKRLDVTYQGAPTTTIVQAIEVGDFYYSDGAIIPKSTVTPPSEGCIGIVYCVDQDFITNESTIKTKGGFTHGLVVAIKDASKGTTWEGAFTAVSQYATANAAPACSSGWYLPNVVEYEKLANGGSGTLFINDQANKLNNGSEEITEGNKYWSNVKYSDTEAQAMYFGPNFGERTSINSSTPYARAALAF